MSLLFVDVCRLLGPGQLSSQDMCEEVSSRTTLRAENEVEANKLANNYRVGETVLSSKQTCILPNPKYIIVPFFYNPCFACASNCVLSLASESGRVM